MEQFELTSDQKSRVQAALLAEEPDEALAVIARMLSPEELHALMLEYNWDDGFHVPMAVIDHPWCERGTASLIYFDAAGPWVDPAELPREHAELLRRVSERLLSGDLPEDRIAYDPGLDRVQLYKFRKAGVPEALLRPSGST